MYLFIASYFQPLTVQVQYNESGIKKFNRWDVKNVQNHLVHSVVFILLYSSVLFCSSRKLLMISYGIYSDFIWYIDYVSISYKQLVYKLKIIYYHNIDIFVVQKLSLATYIIFSSIWRTKIWLSCYFEYLQNKVSNYKFSYSRHANYVLDVFTKIL